VSLAPSGSPPHGAAPSRANKPRPAFIKTTLRIVWVLCLTSAALVGGIVYQARTQCPNPCWIDGLTPVEALRGAPKPLPPR
jgi:hypothetical protein